MAFALSALMAGAAMIPVARAQASCSSTIESCSSAASSSSNTCCVNKPGGLFAQTQFWDTDPVTGPANSWTIHGLWPDNCDGTYSESCDSSRDYTDITTLLQNNGKSDLVTYMSEYMQSNDESNEDFWEHEWSQHGTCVSTLEPSCYSNYVKGQEVADYFQVLVDLFKTLDTYNTLAAAGITPSSSKTYSASSISEALTNITGKPPVLTCDSGAISEIYYGFYVDGPLANGKFVPTDVQGTSSSCSGNIKYLPKQGASTTTGSGGSGPTSSPTSTAPGTKPTGTFSGKGYLNAYSGGQENGCLISAGTWYVSGTCATYTASASGSGFTLSSSKGNCGISGGKFTCGSGVSASTFQASGGYLAYNGQTTFYCSETPSGSEQGTVETSSGKVSVKFEWESV